MNGFNNRKLQSARLYRRYTVKDFAKLLNVSPQTIMLYEKGNVPPPENMVKIADILNFPIAHFFGEEQANNYTNITYYRKSAIVKKSELAVQQWETNIIKQVYAFLTSYFAFPELNISNISLKTPKETAIKLRDKWGLGLEPIDDLQNVIENNGIILTSLDIQDTDAYCSSMDKNMLIVTSSVSTKARTNFNIAHELGHISYHSWDAETENVYNADFKTKENEAHEFASEFLFPTEMFMKELVYPTQLRYYYILKEKWGMSVQALLLKALKNNLIKQFQYINLLKNINRKFETDDENYSFNEGLLQRALVILKDKIGGITLRSELTSFGINIHFNELAKLLHLKEDFFGDSKPSFQKADLRLIK